MEWHRHYHHLKESQLLQVTNAVLCPLPLQLNVVEFSVAGLGMLSGSLTVKASYEPASDSRVNIKFVESTLVSAVGSTAAERPDSLALC